MKLTYDLKVKREIITFLGSNLILNGFKLDIEVEKPLRVLADPPEDFKVIMTRLEPPKPQERNEKLTALVAGNFEWGWWNDFRNSLLNYSH